MKKYPNICLCVSVTVFMAVSSISAVPVSAENTSYDELVTFIVQTDYTPAAVVKAEMNNSFRINAFTERYIENVSENIEAKNTEIRDMIAAELGVDASDGYIYTQTDSGFTITARRGDMDRILAADGVTAVYENGYFYAVPDDEKTDGEAANPAATTTEYKGQGTLIAIIDSGFQVDHPYLNASISSPKLSQTDAESKISDMGYGKYYSEKIPFIYSYGKPSDKLADIALDPDHGTHVAGIAAGKNGTIQNGDIINGAAPEAQLALMACSTTSGGTMSYDIVKKGIDDAVKLGADVINISLGSDYVDVRNSRYSTLSTSITNARKAGVVVCTSQGNASMGFYNKQPLVTNIDYGTAGIVGNIPAAFSVASADTENYYNTMTKLSIGDGTEIAANPAAEVSGVVAFADTVKNATEFVDCGRGQTSDFNGKTLTGKVALIQRGDSTFEDKTKNAKKAGAIAAIIYDNIDEPYINMSGCVLPSVFITKSDGERLAAMTENTTVYADGTGFFELTNYTTAGKPSSFTSWGFSETMKLTPNITGYGGNVYSAAPGSTYQKMSGTSMASPYIAGASACVRSYLNTMPFGELGGVNYADLIQQLLMSTAIPIRYSDDDALAYSPRVQGAGMVSVDNALKIPVVLYNSDNKTLINLGDNSTHALDYGFTLSFTARNFSGEDVTFDNIDVEVTTDWAALNDDNDYVVYGAKTIEPTYTVSPVTVPAYDTAEISIPVKIDLSTPNYLASYFKNGIFIDGFVRLSNDDYYVGLPFSGFRGNWCSVPVWDSTIYDEGGSELIYKDDNVKLDGTYLTTTENKKTVTFGGTGTKYTIISPANADGNYDTLTAVFAPRRSLAGVTLSLVQKNSAKISRTVGGIQNKYSQYKYPLTNTTALTNTLRSLGDGDYTFRMAGVFDSGRFKQTQNLNFPITVTIDNTAPEIDMVLSNDYNTLDVTVTDANYIRSVTVNYTDNEGNAKSETKELDNTLKSYENTFTLTNANPFTISVTAVDYAYNSGTSDDYAITAESGKVRSTAFKKTVTNVGSAETTYTAAEGTVTSDSVTKAFDNEFKTAQTLEGGAGISVVVIVEGLYDNKAKAVFELK